MDKKDKQVDIRTATYRVTFETPGHITYGFWINGAKIGEWTVRQEERVGVTRLITRAGFILTL